MAHVLVWNFRFVMFTIWDKLPHVLVVGNERNPWEVFISDHVDLRDFISFFQPYAEYDSWACDQLRGISTSPAYADSVCRWSCITTTAIRSIPISLRNIHSQQERSGHFGKQTVFPLRYSILLWSIRTGRL